MSCTATSTHCLWLEKWTENVFTLEIMCFLARTLEGVGIEATNKMLVASLRIDMLFACEAGPKSAVVLGEIEEGSVPAIDFSAYLSGESGYHPRPACMSLVHEASLQPETYTA